MNSLIVPLLLVIAVTLCQILEKLTETKPRAEWKNGKWNGVKDV